MTDWQVLTVTGLTIAATVLLIVKLRLNPVVALVIGAVTLGLGTGMGVETTTDTVMRGFGDILCEVGLLIGWGVLMGSLLNSMGAIRRLVEALLKIFGAKGVPYALGLTHGTALQSIFPDVLLVMSAPLARRIAPSLGPNGIGKVSAAIAIGLESGIVLMVPGVATMALAGLLKVPLGLMLIVGLLVVVPTIVIAITVMNFLFDHGWWNPEKDQLSTDELADIEDASAGYGDDSADRHPLGSLPHAEASTGKNHETSLWVMFSPMLLSLVLIASGAVAEIFGFSNPVLTFVSTPLIALLIGLLGTSVIARRVIGRTAVEKSVVSGFRESGQILLLTGAGGSLGAVVAAGSMGDLLSKYFSTTTVAPLLAVWAVAAILHIAVGSVSISAITAAGILAPVAPQIGLNPVLIALAAGAGSLFLVHVTSNTFWLLQSMLGQTTRGTLKTCSVGVSVASVVALGCILILSIFI